MKRQSILVLVTTVLMMTGISSGSPTYTVDVWSEQSTPTVTSYMLELGKIYQIETQGTYICNGLHNLPADAEWHVHIWENYWMESYYEPWEPDYYLDLLVNETSYDWLGTVDGVNFLPHTYSPSHVYRINIMGTGDYATFRIYDSNYQDNGGYLTVMISVIPTPSAILLASIGVGSVTWLRRRRTI